MARRGKLEDALKLSSKQTKVHNRYNRSFQNFLGFKNLLRGTRLGGEELKTLHPHLPGCCGHSLDKLLLASTILSMIKKAYFIWEQNLLQFLNNFEKFVNIIKDRLPSHKAGIRI